MVKICVRPPLWAFLGAIWLIACQVWAFPVALVTGTRSGEVIAINLDSNAVVSRVPGGRSPTALALQGGKAFVASDGLVSVIDLGNLALLDQISIEGRGTAIGTSPDGQHVFVGVRAGGETNRLDLISLAEKRRIRTAPVGVGVSHIVVTPDGKRIYVVNHDSFNVHVFDGSTLTLTREITVAPLGRGAWDKPHYLVPGKDYSRLYLPFQGKALVEIDAHTLAPKTHPFKINLHQHGMVFSPDGTKIYIANSDLSGGPGSLSVIDASKMVETTRIDLGRNHEQVALSPDGRKAYLTGGFLIGGHDDVTLVDLEHKRVLTRIPVGGHPRAIAIKP